MLVLNPKLLIFSMISLVPRRSGLKVNLPELVVKATDAAIMPGSLSRLDSIELTQLAHVIPSI